MTVLMLALKILIFIGIGWFARKIKVMQDGFDKQLTKFLMAVPLPCMIINSFRLSFSMDQLISCPMLLALSVGALAVCFVIGQIVNMMMGRNGLGKSARFALMFTNFTFFGFAVVAELYGNEGSFYYVIFTLLIRVAFYGGAPVLIGSSNERPDLKTAGKQLISPPVVAVFIGLILYVTQLELPDVISSVLTTVGNMCSPLGLMLCGVIIADANLNGIVKYPCVFWLTALRLLVVPAVMLGLFLLLGISKDIIRPLIFYFAMPVASFLPMFFLRYNPDDVDARSMSGFLVVCSTICSVVTIPLWAMILDKI